jgi:hypothetical protein
MARNDLELGAEWVARSAGEPEPAAGQMDELSDGWTRMRAAERAAKADLDAAGHRAAAEHRERDRRAACGPIVGDDVP